MLIIFILGVRTTLKKLSSPHFFIQGELHLKELNKLVVYPKI
jgi:hypothetical protein